MPKTTTTTTTTKQPTAREIAIEILREKGEPMPVKDLTEQVQARAQLSGKTPLATVAAIIYHGAKHGKTFEKTGRGMVGLLPEPDLNAVEKLPPASAQAESPTEDGPAVTPNSVVVKRGRDVTPDTKPKSTKRARAKKQTAKA